MARNCGRPEIGLQAKNVRRVAMLEKHYSIAFLAELWGWSERFLRQIFIHEPGVVKMVRPEEFNNVHDVKDKKGNVRIKRGKREYVSIRIPERVALRVYQRLVAK